MSRRPAHRVGHAQCPYGQLNWSDCDAASAHRWGRCVAMVDAKPEPHTCTNWAVGEDGHCGQHYISAHEKQMRSTREAARRLQLSQAYDAFTELQVADPGYWLRRLRTSAESTVGLAGMAGVEPAKEVLETAAPPRLTPSKGPYRLDSV